MPTNTLKAASANSKGVYISYNDISKRGYIPFTTKNLVQDIQLYGTTEFQTKKQNVKGFNNVQVQLFKRVFQGFDAYSFQEINAMTPEQKTHIKRLYTQGQTIINHLKKEVLFQEVDSFLSALFPKSKTVQKMTSIDNQGPLVEESFTLEELNITNQQVAERFIANKLLPKNFFELTVKLPKVCNTSSSLMVYTN